MISSEYVLNQFPLTRSIMLWNSSIATCQHPKSTTRSRLYIPTSLMSSSNGLQEVPRSASVFFVASLRRTSHDTMKVFPLSGCFWCAWIIAISADDVVAPWPSEPRGDDTPPAGCIGESKRAGDGGRRICFSKRCRLSTAPDRLGLGRPLSRATKTGGG